MPDANSRLLEPLFGVIFDLDGTVTDTLPIAYAAFRAAIAAFAVREFTDAELLQLSGPSEEGIFRQIVPNNWELCFERYLEEYTIRHGGCNAPFPGLIEVLDYLRDRQLPRALVTGKASRAVTITLGHIGIAHYFDPIEAGSPGGNTKVEALRRVLAQWRARASSVVYVGDVPSDMEAANATGVIAAGAAWAAAVDAAALTASGAEIVFSRVDDFLAWLRTRAGH
jgi:pyrophosphatase PpaX